MKRMINKQVSNKVIDYLLEHHHVVNLNDQETHLIQDLINAYLTALINNDPDFNYQYHGMIIQSFLMHKNIRMDLRTRKQLDENFNEVFKIVKETELYQKFRTVKLAWDKEGIQNIRTSIPGIVQGDKITTSEFTYLLNTNRRKRIVQELFKNLEAEVRLTINEEVEPNLEYIEKITHYLNLFCEENNSFSQVYSYRKAKNALSIIENHQRQIRKTEPELYKFLNEIYRRLNIVKTKSLDINKDHYRFIMKFIYEIKDIKDIKELIERYPDFVNLKDKDGTPIICNLIEAFVKMILNKKIPANIPNLTYHQNVIEIFLESKNMIIDEDIKQSVEKILICATNKVEDSQKLLWLKSLCHTITGSKAIEPEEVLEKYNVYIWTPEDEKSKFKLNKEGRLIINDQKIVTIDGAYSTDLDDAISIKFIDGKYHVYGYIADVASLIKRGSRIDMIARKKVNTFYFPDRIEHMFPNILSEDLCSLTAGSPKNTMRFYMVINQNGEIEREIDIAPASILVNRRLSHDEANHILIKGDPDYELEVMLNHFSNLSSILQSKSKRINIDAYDYFDFDHPTKKSNAHKIIESIMVLINSQTTAKLGKNSDIPFFFRTHKFYRKEELEKIKDSFQGFYKDDNLPAINDILNSLANIADNAKYQRHNIGHQALDEGYYGHVTSPIRRYADVEIQRIIYDFLLSEPTLEKINFYEQYLDSLMDHLNNTIVVNKKIEKEYIRSKILSKRF